MTETGVLLRKALANTALLKVILKDWSVFIAYTDCVAVHIVVLLQERSSIYPSWVERLQMPLCKTSSWATLQSHRAKLLEAVVTATGDMTKSWQLEEEIYPIHPAWNSS